MTRTWCKYGDCSLEKLESETKTLNKIWTDLEKDWTRPKDIEDVYRIYPLLDTTASLARKRLEWLGKENKKYKVCIVEPKEDSGVDTSQYLYSDEKNFFSGTKKECSLLHVVSTCLHGSSYVYMDTRKSIADTGPFEIYVLVKTDLRTQYINIRSYINSVSKLIEDEIKKKFYKQKIPR